MKMRIEGNSIRLRLNEENIAELKRTGQVKESIEFDHEEERRLVYAVEVDPEASHLEVDYDGGRLVVRLPRLAAREWLETERVEVKGERRLGKRETLKILVEKDLPCGHPAERELAQSAEAGRSPSALVKAAGQKG